jgi:hypothetical protein
MGGTYWNIIVFILTTLVYFLAFKPKLTTQIIENKELYEKYTKDSYFRLTIYFLLVILFQFGINIGVIANKCGGSAGQNIGMAALMTFIPWILIFGIVIVVLIVFPGFKSAFSDVVGYFMVSGSANEALSDLLINPNINEKMEGFGGEPDEKEYKLEIEQEGGTTKKQMQDVADVIIKLCGNMSILINQIVPSNFNDYWNILTPLMKTQYQTLTPDTLSKKQQLLDLVVSRDDIGEGFWYGYTALLIISIVQYNILNRGCKRSQQEMQDNYDKFLKAEEEAKKKKEETDVSYKLGPTQQ